MAVVRILRNTMNNLEAKNVGEQCRPYRVCADSLWNGPYCLGGVRGTTKLYRYMLHVRTSLKKEYSFMVTSMVTFVCSIAEERNDAVEARPVVLIRTIFSSKQQQWVLQDRLVPLQHLSLILNIFTLTAYGTSFVTAQYISMGLKCRCKRRYWYR